MQNPNQFNQFMTAGPTNQPPGQNPAMFGNFPNQMNPQLQQFNTQQFPNPQMQFQGMPPQGGFNMNGPQGGPPGQGPNPQQNMGAPQKQRLIVQLENNERGFYSSMLSQADPEDIGKMDGKQLVPFFKRSGLPVDVLKKIWLMASHDNKTMDKEDFYVALRLIAYAQNNIEVSPQSIMMNIKVPLPKMQAPAAPKKVEPPTEVPPPTNPQFGDINMSHTSGLGGMQPGLPGPGGMPMGGMQNNFQGDLMGGDMPNMSNNMGMPSQNNFQGNLMGGDMPNMSNNMMGMPSQIQPPMQNDLLGNNMGGNMSSTQSPSMIPPAPQFDTGFSQPVMDNHTSNFQGSPSNSMMGNAPSMQMQRGLSFSGPALEEPIYSGDQLSDITPEHINYYEQMYAQQDPSQKGLITQEEARDIFGRSGLPVEILFQIWMFCDTGDKGCLDKPEFMLALHLIAASKKNIPLPEKLPLKYERFLKDAKRTLPSKDYLLEKILQAQQDNQAMMSALGDQPAPQESYQESYQEPVHHYDAPATHYEAPVSHYEEPVSHYEAPATHYEAPVSHYEAPASHYEAPTYSDNKPKISNEGNFGTGQVRDDVPLMQNTHMDSSIGSGAVSGNIIQRIEEHHRELVAAVTQIKDTNTRILQEKTDDVHKLNRILMNCQTMLDKLRAENDALAGHTAQAGMGGGMNTSMNQRHSMPVAQPNLGPPGGAVYGGSPQKLRASPGVSGGMNMGGQVDNFDQAGVDFQKEFASDWNVGAPPKSNFDEFNF